MMKQHPHRNSELLVQFCTTFHLSIYLYKTISAATPHRPLIGRHEEPYLPVLCHGMAYLDLACHIEWSQCERKTFHGERFTCKFFHCMPHPDLACRTESSNLEIFNCQSSVMVCHTLTLPVLLSCCELIANEEQVVHDNIHMECRGERTLLFSEVARRFHLTLSTHFNKTVVYGPAKWIYLIHIKVPRFE